MPDQTENASERDSQPVETANPAPTRCPSCAGLGDVPCDHKPAQPGRTGIVAELRDLAAKLTARANERDEIGDDDSGREEDTCAEDGTDCHTVSAVATWFRAAQMLNRRADELASERPNAGQHGDLYAESTDAVYVYDAVTDDWSGFTRFGHAVDVPADAVPLHGRSVAEAEDEVQQVLKANKELRARADAAEAELAGQTVKIQQLTRQLDDAQSAARLMKTHYVPRSERDEAREKLADIRAVVDEWLTNCEATSAGGMEAVQRIIDRTRGLVTDREEPAQGYDALYDAIGAELDRRLNRALQQLDTRHEAIYAAITVLRPDARPSDEPAWDVEADTHRISEDHEGPAGETKPRTLFGVPIPTYIVEKPGGLLVCEHESHPEYCREGWGKPGNTPQFGEWVAEHTHSLPVERQADSEAQSGNEEAGRG
ncbi:hypothetical protein [Amycolatopsis dendrobii]|uniref:Uncharacterized protein n=1 Tax=Amycolatopsis dendrobii TaxID=2760662 RepID=A0A7W3ZAM9_9PSEU|nr:hypothetical protein [Amycolatopsis dendrobii]MBB1153974.1 hypothetical protein [Amycolatopsis dendrobii]